YPRAAGHSTCPAAPVRQDVPEPARQPFPSVHYWPLKFMPCHGRPGLGQGEVKRRALARFGFGPDPAAMALDNAPGRGQARAAAFEFVVPVQALEDPEELLRKTHVESGPIVPDVEGHLVRAVP